MVIFHSYVSLPEGIEVISQPMEVVTMVIQLYLLSEYVDRSVVAGGRRHRCDD